METTSNVTTTSGISAVVETLRALLYKEYNSDFAFVVCAKGKVLAASNKYHGKVFSKVKK